MIIRLLRPWVLAAGSSFVAYCLAKKQQHDGKRLREAKLELVEQQRTINRLRAEIGKERAQRQEVEKQTEQVADEQPKAESDGVL
jgi:hypothetical protein